MFYNNREIYWSNFALVDSTDTAEPFCLKINGLNGRRLQLINGGKVHNHHIIKQRIFIGLKLFWPVIKSKRNVVGAERHNWLLFYRFWRCASSVWTRRPSPRRPWPRVRWGVCRIQRGRSPQLQDSGIGRLAAVGPLPRLPADHPSVSAGSIRAQVKKRSSSDAPRPHAPSRQRTVILLHTAAFHLPLRPVAENLEWFLPTVVIRPTQREIKNNNKETLKGRFAKPLQLRAPSLRH